MILQDNILILSRQIFDIRACSASCDLQSYGYPQTSSWLAFPYRTYFFCGTSSKAMWFVVVCCWQLDGPDMSPTITDMNSNTVPSSSSAVSVHVVRKPGTALGMSIAGGRGSIPFIGNDEVNHTHDNSRRNQLLLILMLVYCIIIYQYFLLNFQWTGFIIHSRFSLTSLCCVFSNVNFIHAITVC